MQNDIVFYISASPQISAIKQRINELQNLPQGWDFGQGDVISNTVARRCLRICEYGVFLGLKANVRPSTDGSLILCLFYDDNFLYITIREDGLFDTTYEKGIGSDYDILDNQDDISLTTLNQYISTWFSLGPYIGKSIMQKASAFQATPLINTKGASQSSMRSAPKQLAIIQSANTYNNIIRP